MVGSCPRRQLNPGMSPTVVNGMPRRRKIRVGESADGDADGDLLAPRFGVKHGCPTARAEPEGEDGAVVADAHVLACRAGDLIGGSEARRRRKDAARPPLAGKAVTNADPQRLPLVRQCATDRSNTPLFAAPLSTSLPAVAFTPIGHPILSCQRRQRGKRAPSPGPPCRLRRGQRRLLAARPVVLSHGQRSHFMTKPLRPRPPGHAVARP